MEEKRKPGRPKGTTGRTGPRTATTRAMLADYAAGMSLRQVAEKYGCSHQNVYQAVKIHTPDALRRKA